MGSEMNPPKAMYWGSVEPRWALDHSGGDAVAGVWELEGAGATEGQLKLSTMPG